MRQNEVTVQYNTTHMGAISANEHLPNITPH